MNNLLIIRDQTQSEDDEFGEDSLIVETAKAYACISTQNNQIMIHVMWVKGDNYRQGSGKEFVSLIRAKFPSYQVVANGVDKHGWDDYAVRARLFWLEMLRLQLINRIEWNG